MLAAVDADAVVLFLLAADRRNADASDGLAYVVRLQGFCLVLLTLVPSHSLHIEIKSDPLILTSYLTALRLLHM